jgi:protoporphyrin/coproporphyrin ferrochelatase
MPERDRTGVLCMAYGSPRDETAVAGYLAHIRGGRHPSAEALEDLLARYRRIGFSPLDRITTAQADALGAHLGLPTFVGMKHAAPFVRDAAAAAKAAGVSRLIGLPLAPHYAGMSVGAYERELRRAWDGELLCVRGFHDHPAFTAAVREVVVEALAGFDAELVVFTAHSLPERIAAEGDDYPGRLLESAELVAAGMTLPAWRTAFQSASATGEAWFGPDLLDVIDSAGAARILVCPIGFVADHLEILYDVDVEAREHALARGVELRRTSSLNDRQAFIAALGAVVGETAGFKVPA